MRGEVCVANGGEQPTQGLTILDTVQTQVEPGRFQDYVSEPVDVSAKPVLGVGEEYCYPYEFIFLPVGGDNVVYRNVVSVTILNHVGWLPGGNYCVGPDACPFGPSPMTDFTLPEAPTTEAPQLVQPQATETPATEPPLIEPTATEPPAAVPLPSESPAPASTETPPTETTISLPPQVGPSATETAITELPPTDSP